MITVNNIDKNIYTLHLADIFFIANISVCISEFYSIHI